jgi:hypothetical protein
MYFTTRDKQRLKSISLARLVDHLRAAGWQLDKVYSDERRRIWEKNEHEVVVPAHANFADHLRRIADVVTTLAHVEDKYPDAILDDLLRETEHENRPPCSLAGSSWKEMACPLAYEGS